MRLHMFFFKQKTAYEMRISDWSSDVCSSDLAIERAISEHGPRLALIVWPGVQYRSGQAFDLREIARLGHAAGALVGFDCAHAAGNLPMQLHDSGADFAVWCHYKYMRSEEHTSEFQSLMRISYAVFCLKKKKRNHHTYI